MNKIFTIFVLLLLAANAIAQDFNAHWISYPKPDSVSQIWFRQSYKSTTRPIQASITVASTGNFDLYVNEKNVSTDVLIPYRTNMSNNPIAITYDVSRFLKAGINTIAVWYSPSYPSINTRQIAVSYYGRDTNGRHFEYNSDKNWICKQANFALNYNGSESINSNYQPVKWNSQDIDLACWQSAMLAPTDNKENVTPLHVSYKATKLSKIQQPINQYSEGDSVFYAVFNPFMGNIRVTLRGAKKGETININGLEYVCSGVTDEQAYSKFTSGYYRKIAIKGDKQFNSKHISKIEALEIMPYIHNSYIY